MEKYIGMDVHATSRTAAVVNAQGKRLGSQVLAALVEFLKTQTGTIHLCIEEGAQSEWLVEILSPYVERMVVTIVSESRGQKSDVPHGGCTASSSSCSLAHATRLRSREPVEARCRRVTGGGHRVLRGAVDAVHVGEHEVQ